MRAVAVVLVALATGAVAATLYARGDEHASDRPRGGCRDWVAAPGFRAEIAAARPLVWKMKRAFAAPGISVAIGAGGRLVWSRSCGFADVARRREVTRTTQFRIGSVSKTLTAVTAARLSTTGRLGFDDDVREHVAAFPRDRPPLTLRQLGGHLGGIRHYEDGEAINTTRYRSLTHSLRVFVDDPLVAAPGSAFHYSSYGFNLLGAAIEHASKTDFGTAVDATLLRPLGMTHTSVGQAPSGGTRFYEVTGDRRAVAAPRIDLSDRYPSGGFLSTAEDLVRLGFGATDQAFVDRAAQLTLFTSQRTSAGERTGYGFGFEVRDSPVGAFAGHTGNVVGGTAFILLHPRTRVVVALVTNVGFVTAAAPPDLSGTPEPPQLALPFIRRVQEETR